MLAPGLMQKNCSIGTIGTRYLRMWTVEPPLPSRTSLLGVSLINCSCSAKPWLPWKSTCRLKKDHFKRKVVFQPQLFSFRRSILYCKSFIKVKSHDSRRFPQSIEKRFLFWKPSISGSIIKVGSTSHPGLLHFLGSGNPNLNLHLPLESSVEGTPPMPLSQKIRPYQPILNHHDPLKTPHTVDGSEIRHPPVEVGRKYPVIYREFQKTHPRRLTTMIPYYLRVFWHYLRGFEPPWSLNNPSYHRGHYITKQREIPQNCHRFVLFDSPKIGNLMTPHIIKGCHILSPWSCHVSFFPPNLKATARTAAQESSVTRSCKGKTASRRFCLAQKVVVMIQLQMEFQLNHQLYVLEQCSDMYLK